MPLRHLSIAVCLGAVLAPAVVSGGALQRLSVSANHRFLQQADGTPFFWLGDTAWLLFSKLDRAATQRYLDDRRDKGFTVVQVMVLHSQDERGANGAPALIDGDPGRPRVTPGPPSPPATARDTIT